ncbi:MAG: MFS transporter [Pseudomonadota bacterium]
MVAAPDLSTDAQRDAQANLIRATLMGSLSKDIVTGPFCVAFAVQVLRFSDGQVATMLTVLPLIVVLRYPYLDRIRDHPRQAVTIRSRYVQLSCLLALLLLPTGWITLPVLIAIAVLFVYGNEFLQNAVWMSFVAEVTARGDRGRFLGRLRTGKQATSLAFALFGFFYVGEALDRGEHRVLILIVIALLLNSLFWLHRVPPAPPPDGLRGFSGRGRFRHTIRTSPLMRRPLALGLLGGVLDWPILMVYLVGTLNMPANLLMLNVVAGMLGPIFSVFLWGRSADRMGERRIFLVYYGCALALYPALLFVPDFDAVADGSRAWWIGLFALLAFNFLQGILLAGRMMAESMLQARYVNAAEGFHAINVQTMLKQIFAAALTAAGGLMLAATTDSGGQAAAWGVIWLDPFRLLTIGIVTAAIFAGLAVARGIPDD